MIEPRIHDPCMIHAPDAYYVYGTGLSTLRSTDLIHWTRLARVFPTVPAWASKEIPRAGFPWAPDISYFNGQYHLYYCISRFGRNRSVIGLATNAALDPAAPGYRWIDHGKVVESLVTDDYNAIDPNIILDDAGTPWLSFGSFWDGIKLRKLVATTGMPDPADSTLYSIAARPRTPEHPLEAPCIVRHDAAYFLFVSFDFCCRGVNSTYRTMVGRASKITGPYLDKEGVNMMQGGGTQILAGDPHGRVRGPGGGMVLHDGDRWLLVHHFYDADNRGISKLQIHRLTWSPDNWPIPGDPITQP